MAIKVYRVKIEGFVVDAVDHELTPSEWGLGAIVNAMGVDMQITETLVDTIEDEPEQPVSMEPLETAIDILQRSQSQDNLPTAQNDVRLALEGLYRYHSEVSARAKGESWESSVSGG